jgi:hypothetical protein
VLRNQAWWLQKEGSAALTNVLHTIYINTSLESLQSKQLPDDLDQKIIATKMTTDDNIPLTDRDIHRTEGSTTIILRITTLYVCILLNLCVQSLYYHRSFIVLVVKQCSKWTKKKPNSVYAH